MALLTAVSQAQFVHHQTAFESARLGQEHEAEQQQKKKTTCRRQASLADGTHKDQLKHRLPGRVHARPIRRIFTISSTAARNSDRSFLDYWLAWSRKKRTYFGRLAPAAILRDSLSWALLGWPCATVIQIGPAK